MRRYRDQLSLADQAILGLIEGVMTLAGLIVVIFPLALWSVPQMGPSVEQIFTVVLSAGSGSFVAIIALSYLKGALYPRPVSEGEPVGAKARLAAYQAWENAQEIARTAEDDPRAGKRGLWRDLGFMVRIATLLATVYVLLNIGAWVFMDSYFGSSEVLSAAERWRLHLEQSMDWSSK